MALRGDALSILQTVPEAQQRDYSAMVAQIDIRYGDRHREQVHQAQLKSCSQKNDESLQEYHSHVARLVRLAYPSAPEDFGEQLAVQVFIDGLRDCETQQALRLGRHKLLCEALTHAMEFEAAKHASRSHARVRQLSTTEKQPAESELLDLLRKMLNDHQEKEAKKEEQKEQRATRRGRGARCWNCGNFGHLQSSCRGQSRSTQSPWDEATPSSRPAEPRAGTQRNQENSN